jgi:hypothetical protein
MQCTVVKKITKSATLDVNVSIGEPDANYIAKDLTLLPSCAGHHC